MSVNVASANASAIAYSSSSSMAVYNCAYKKFLVASLNLPYDITNEIQGYLFYDKETSAKRAIKKNIVSSIDTMLGNRKRTNSSTEDWEFVVNKKTMSAINCRICGNYLMSHKMIEQLRLFCFCNRDLYSYHDENDADYDDDWDF